MKASELTIGNWVSHIPSQNKSADGNFIVSEINLFDADTINGLASIDCEPIPLTEEWLLKFGFELIHTRKSFGKIVSLHVLNGFHIKGFDGEFDTEIGECLCKTIKHVHQLQNLYFALKGEELTLNTL